MTKPIIKAKFKLDEDGRPSFVEGDGLRHYRIELFVENAPKDAFAATYQLDPTYFDPVREALATSGFKEEITSYGDYDLQVRLRAKGGGEMLAAPLSGALKSSYGRDATPEIMAAIRDIETDQGK